MIQPESIKIFHDMYDFAAKVYPELEQVTVLYNIGSSHGVELQKGDGEDAGSYRILCRMDNDEPDEALSDFALGLALVVYDLKCGPYDAANAPAEEKIRLHMMYQTIMGDFESDEDESAE